MVPEGLGSDPVLLDAVAVFFCARFADEIFTDFDFAICEV